MNENREKRVRGPTSALTSFLSEQGISANEIRSRHLDRIHEAERIEKEDLPEEEQPKTIFRPSKKKKSRPFLGEQATRKVLPSLSNLCSQVMCKNMELYSFADLADESVTLISKIISKNRILDASTLKIFKERPSVSLFDCSLLTEDDYLFFCNSGLTNLTLRFAGHLSDNALIQIIKSNELETIELHGSHLLTKKSIQELNKSTTLTSIKLQCINVDIALCKPTLQISECDFQAKLENISWLDVSGTLVRDCDLASLNKLTTLKVNDCPNITSKVLEGKSLECFEARNVKLDPQMFKEFVSRSNLVSLDVSYTGLESLNLTQVNVLKVCGLNLDSSSLTGLAKLPLEHLDLSWCLNVTDEVLDKFDCFVLVWGCHKLTERTIKSNVVGHPSETKYLLNQ